MAVYLHYATALHPVTAPAEEITATPEEPMALRITGATHAGVQHWQWYLSHPWRGHQIIEVAYDLSTCQTQVWGGGECLEVVTSHSMEEGLAALRFKVIIEA